LRPDKKYDDNRYGYVPCQEQGVTSERRRGRSKGGAAKSKEGRKAGAARRRGRRKEQGGGGAAKRGGRSKEGSVKRVPIQRYSAWIISMRQDANTT
jgi:hypothetical protein